MRMAPNTLLPLFPHLLGTASSRVTQVFFHYAEVEGSERGRHPSIRPGDEFEFELGCDERSGKQCAIHLRSLPRGTVRFEERLLEGQRGTVVSLKCAPHACLGVCTTCEGMQRFSIYGNICVYV